MGERFCRDSLFVGKTLFRTGVQIPAVLLDTLPLLFHETSYIKLLTKKPRLQLFEASRAPGMTATATEISCVRPCGVFLEQRGPG